MLRVNNHQATPTKIFEAYLIEVSNGNIDDYEVVSIKAETREIAWDKAITLIEPNLFNSARMLVLRDIIDEEDIF